MDTFETVDDIIHTEKSGNLNRMIVDKDTDKKWIQLPKQLGGHKKKVLEKKEIKCICEKHNTRVYILEGEYSTMNCTTIQQWAWVKTVDI